MSIKIDIIYFRLTKRDRNLKLLIYKLITK